MAPAAKPSPMGKRVANFSTNKYAGMAKMGWGRLVNIAQSTDTKKKHKDSYSELTFDDNQRLKMTLTGSDFAHFSCGQDDADRQAFGNIVHREGERDELPQLHSLDPTKRHPNALYNR